MPALAEQSREFYLQTRPFTPQDGAAPIIQNRFRRLDENVASTLRRERQSRPENGGTAAWIDYFDTNWRKEHLPQDWYNLRAQNSKKVGFMMDSHMDMLQDPKDTSALADWAQKTKQDLLGFKLEFLTDKVVYPRSYKRNPNDPTRLEDPLYGKAKDGVNNADIAEIISDQERNGSVKRAVQNIKEFFQTAPDGSIAVMTSPKGKTGFRSEDGADLEYPDSYFFIQVKNGDEVMNYTLKTDFGLAACREAIQRMTGKKLSEKASLEEYTGALAFIKPGERKSIKSITDVVNLLAGIQPTHAFIDKENEKTTTWQDVHTQIEQGEALYNFDKKTHKVIEDYVDFAKSGNYTKEYLQKGIAASLLLMGDIFARETAITGYRHDFEPGTVYISDSGKVSYTSGGSFGDVLVKTANRVGCTGSRKVTVIKTMGGERIAIGRVINPTGLGTFENPDGLGRLDYECPKGHANTRHLGRTDNVCMMCDAEVGC